MTRRHLTIRGRVQGVGFRWFARQSAETLGLTGWARNLEDGSVEVEAEGTPEALETFVERLKTGNPAAKVDSIEVATIPVKGDRGFRTG